MPNYKKLQKMIEEEKQRREKQIAEAKARQAQLKEESIRDFQNEVINLLSQELCEELELSFEVTTSRTFSADSWNDFHAIISLDDRRKIKITAGSKNGPWWVGVIRFHHEKDLDGGYKEVVDSSGGYWYASDSLKEKVLLTYVALINTGNRTVKAI